LAKEGLRVLLLLLLLLLLPLLPPGHAIDLHNSKWCC